MSAVEIVERAEGEVILGRTYDQAYASTQEMVTVSRKARQRVLRCLGSTTYTPILRGSIYYKRKVM